MALRCHSRRRSERRRAANSAAVRKGATVPELGAAMVAALECRRAELELCKCSPCTMVMGWPPLMGSQPGSSARGGDGVRGTLTRCPSGVLHQHGRLLPIPLPLGYGDQSHDFLSHCANLAGFRPRKNRACLLGAASSHSEGRAGNFAASTPNREAMWAF